MRSAHVAISLLCLIGLAHASEDVVGEDHPHQEESEATVSDAGAIGPLRAAAAAGEPEAQSKLAFAYQEGRGVPADSAAAIEWHRKVAEQNVVASQAALGRSLFKGIGTLKQPIRGLHWIRKAALAGEPNAQALLGATFLHGFGRNVVKVNYAKAESGCSPPPSRVLPRRNTTV